MDIKKTVFQFLKNTELFCSVPAAMLEEASGNCRIARVKRSQFLYQKGDVANYLYILKRVISWNSFPTEKALR